MCVEPFNLNGTCMGQVTKPDWFA